MKSFICACALALAAGVSAQGSGHGAHGGHGGAGGMSGMAPNATGMGGMDMGNMAPNGAMITGSKPAKIQTVMPKFRTRKNPRSTRVVMTYGPFTMASANDTSLMKMPGMEDENGVVDVNWKGNAQKPCEDCTLKYMTSSLMYTDGKPANLDTGAWLHHMTMSVAGPGRSDFKCGKEWEDGERVSVIHNDRNETYFGKNGVDEYGYYLAKEDKMYMLLELKNEMDIPKQVYFTVTFEYSPGKPKKMVKPLWLDAADCGAVTSEIHPPEGQKFAIHSKEWISPVDGEFLTTVGHMHEGGTQLMIHVNNQTVCTSTPKYGGDPAYQPNAEAIKYGALDIPHITKYSPCVDFGKIKKGDVLTLSAEYDFEKYKPGLGESGKPHGVMGIAMTMVGVDA